MVSVASWARAALALLLTALAVLVAPAAQAAAEAPRTLPPAGSTIVVQPAAVQVLTGPVRPGSVRVSVVDGCENTLTTGRVGLSAEGFAAPLPAQNAGPGTWQVTWSATAEDGSPRSGSWSFGIAQGVPCDGAAGDAAPGGHHVGLVGASGVLQPAGDDATPGLRLSQSFAAALGLVVAFLLGGVGLLLLGIGAARRTARRADLAVVVGAQAVAISLALPGRTHGWPVRVGLGLTGALLVAGCVLAATAAGTRASRRDRGQVAAAAGVAVVVVAALVATFQTGRAVLLDIPAAGVSGVVLTVAAVSGLVTALLAGGGWYGRPAPVRRSAVGVPADRVDPVRRSSASG